MVSNRKETTVDLSWLSYAPEELTRVQLKRILRRYKLSVKPFDAWIYGQTCPLIIRAGKAVLGFYTHDLEHYLAWKLKGRKPIWD